VDRLPWARDPELTFEQKMELFEALPHKAREDST